MALAAISGGTARAEAGPLEPDRTAGPDVSGLIDVSPTVSANRMSIASRRSRATCRSAPSGALPRCRPTPARNGRATGRGPRACSPLPSRSRRLRCFPTIRLSPSLARRAPACQAGGRPRAHIRRMVVTRSRNGSGTGLLLGRGRRRGALLGLRAGDGQDAGDRLSSLVPARNLRMTGPRYAELQVTSHFSFLRGARSCEELFAPRRLWASRRLPSPTATRWPASSAPTRPPRPRASGWWSAAGSTSPRHVDPGLPHRSSRLCPAVPPAVPRQEARRQGKVRSRLDDLAAYGEGLIVVLVPDSADEIARSASAACAKLSATAAIWRSRCAGVPTTSSGCIELSNLAT